MNNKFPQINRKLTAPLILIVLLLISLMNLLQNLIFETSEEKKLRFEVMQFPYLGSTHEKLGRYYLGISNKDAEREYALAQSSKVLGVQTQPWQTWQNFLRIQKSQNSEIKYWEKVRESYPDYTYSILKLAILNLEEKDAEKARNYLSAAIEKNPADETARKLAERLK